LVGAGDEGSRERRARLGGTQQGVLRDPELRHANWRAGVVYVIETRHFYCAVAPDSWKARQISDGQDLAVTVPVRRGGLLSLVAPIPPATVSFHARAIVHPAGSLDIGSSSPKLQLLLPKDRREATVLELVPEGSFLTYGIGVSLKAMLDPVVARAHVPIT
jgi:hypothetical protein